MIGLSLSFCVSDILRGRKREEDVTLIIAGTAIRPNDPEHLTYVLTSYATSYWCADPEQGREIARRLWDAGKIFQPRVHGGEAPNIGAGHWIAITQQMRLL